MKKVCPHCGFGIGETWHKHYGIQKLEKGSVEGGIPVVGKVELRRETLVMVYVCELTNLPFVLAMEKAHESG
jgi:hypothetical protein